MNKKTGVIIGGPVFCAAAAIVIAFVPGHEGDALKPYRDVGGVWTACGGVAYVDPNKTYTPQQCKDLTNTTIGKFMVQVAGMLTQNAPAEILAADTSFAYNIGIVGFSHSTTLKLQNEGDLAGGCNAMLKWYMVGGRDCRIRANNCYGVWTRRNDERDLCMKGVK